MQSTERFSSRVEDYVAARPSYPAELLQALQTNFGLQGKDTLADIGSGSGILTKMFLDNGNEVFAVEPNDAMRAAAEALLRGYRKFHSVAGAAENTSLPAYSVAGVVCGQAFHWFDPAASSQEFRRILRPSGWVGLAWNERGESTPFEREYENFLRKWASKYSEIDHHANEEKIGIVFAPTAYRKFAFPNHQTLDREGFERRIFSKSFMPQRGDSRVSGVLDDMRLLFDRYQKNGRIRLEYQTKLYCGRL